MPKWYRYCGITFVDLPQSQPPPKVSYKNNTHDPAFEIYFYIFIR